MISTNLVISVEEGVRGRVTCGTKLQRTRGKNETQRELEYIEFATRAAFIAIKRGAVKLQKQANTCPANTPLRGKAATKGGAA